MEVDQFISPKKKAGMKACKLCRRRKRDGSSYQECSQEGHQETNEAEEDNILLKNLSNYFRYFSIFFSVSSDNTRFSCWGHDQLGRMGKKSLQLEDDNKMSHCSQLRYTGNFFGAVSLVMR